MPGLIGKKIGMTRVIQEDGLVIPVTVISVPDAVVTQVKTADKDGYNAVVLGVEPLAKPTKTKKFRTLKEFAFENTLEKDATVTLDILQDVEKVSITATTKGKGFAGVVKRYNFRGQPGSHGHSSKHKHGGGRIPGSVGARAKPGRIKPGKKLPGHMGTDTQTRHNVPVVKVDVVNKLLAIKAPVPGPIGNTVYIKF
ncbi:MAG: 50S ribosomal protein L3 [Candidatus Altimarinota bacterium]